MKIWVLKPLSMTTFLLWSNYTPDKFLRQLPLPLKKPLFRGLFISKQYPGDDVFSRPVARELSSALRRFTSEFGMVSGGATALESPGYCLETCFVCSFKTEEKGP